ncbi:phage tail protein [Actinobaculum sp. 352]|uniref:phage tail tube protein n=1 Tax=Actinobaculum sp. 352 TaxID=2490946 RepID=UPI000F7E149E|nr:phage tail protein [Actinobaculum sp. 352]RTE50390.1 phage tail protein [Actinobaculum sp. 352]
MALPEPMVGAPVSATGGVAYAPTDTALPTDASATLDSAFVLGGLISEDGCTLSPNRSQEQKRAWGGKIVRTIQTEYGLTVTFTFLESSKAEVLKAVYGDENVTISAGKIAVLHNEKQPERKAYVLNMLDGKRKRRIVLPNAQLAQTGDIQYVHSDLIQYSVELTGYEDEAGNNGYEYIDDDAITGD